jgi:hypothetical protein
MFHSSVSLMTFYTAYSFNDWSKRRNNLFQFVVECKTCCYQHYIIIYTHLQYHYGHVMIISSWSFVEVHFQAHTGSSQKDWPLYILYNIYLNSSITKVKP